MSHFSFQRHTAKVTSNATEGAARIVTYATTDFFEIYESFELTRQAVDDATDSVVHREAMASVSDRIGRK